MSEGRFIALMCLAGLALFVGLVMAAALLGHQNCPAGTVYASGYSSHTSDVEVDGCFPPNEVPR